MSEKQSIQKLRLLRISLENRLEEFPTLAESVKGQDQNGDTPPLLPRPAQLTGQSCVCVCVCVYLVVYCILDRQGKLIRKGKLV